MIPLHTQVKLPSLFCTLQKYGLQSLIPKQNQVLPSLHSIESESQQELNYQQTETIKNQQKSKSVKRKRMECIFPQCCRDARKQQLCYVHGSRPSCKTEGCTKVSQKGGACLGHGGGRRCAIPDCQKSSQSGGKCYAHGGGRRCSVADCNKACKMKGFCQRHYKVSTIKFV